MYSIRQSTVRESPPPRQSSRDNQQEPRPESRYSASTMTEDSTLFMIHQLRQQIGTLPRKRKWWERWLRLR